MPWSDQPRLELGSCHVSAPLRDAGEARTQVRPNVIPSDAPRQSDRQNPRTHAVYFVYVQTGQSQMKMQQNNCFADPSARFFGGVVDDAHVLRAKNRQRRGLAVQPARRTVVCADTENRRCLIVTRFVSLLVDSSGSAAHPAVHCIRRGAFRAIFACRSSSRGGANSVSSCCGFVARPERGRQLHFYMHVCCANPRGRLRRGLLSTLSQDPSASSACASSAAAASAPASSAASAGAGISGGLKGKPPGALKGRARWPMGERPSTWMAKSGW